MLPLRWRGGGQIYHHNAQGPVIYGRSSREGGTGGAMPGPMDSLNAGVMEAVDDVNEAVRTGECLCLLTLLVCLTRGQDRKPAHMDLLSPWQPPTVDCGTSTRRLFSAKGRGGDF